MSSLSRSILPVLWSALLAFLITLFASGAWVALLIGNISTTPAVPWSVPLMALILWAMWQYLGGRWGPRSTSETRHRYLRARPVPLQLFAWSLVFGVLAIVALAGYWIVMFQLFKMPGNVIPDYSGYPVLTVVPVLVMASLVAPLSEEPAFRGYAQSILEGAFRGPVVPVTISSVLFALAHVTQGFLLPKLFVYFLVGLAFGGIAYLTNSILPAIPVHILGDLTFFTLVWPFDTQRPLVWDTGANMEFWMRVGQALIFTVLALLAFRQLARTARRLQAAESIGIVPA